MLIRHPRQSAADLTAWEARERADALHAQTAAFRRRVAEACSEISRFAADGRCYAGVSWGKDSTVLAHLIAEVAPAVPLVWVRLDEVLNPDCLLVRDAFRAAHPAALYDEVPVAAPRDASGQMVGTGRLEIGFAVAQERHGARHISGVRGDESAARTRRMRAFGLSTSRTCAPLGRWSAADVYAYLFAHDLPVHPAYACSLGGLLDRDRIRVASLGGQRGTGHGRAEWERRYYGRELDAIERQEPKP